MIVVKVGGSLFDLPDLGRRLRDFLADLPDNDRLVVPGGGATADVVRAYDHRHGLGEEASHWLALRACSLNAHFLAVLLPEAHIVPQPRCGLNILDPLAFALEDEGREAALPHTWDAT